MMGPIHNNTTQEQTEAAKKSCPIHQKGQANLLRKVSDFKEKFKKDAETLVKNVFPRKIIEIEDLYRSLPPEGVQDIHTDLNIPVPSPEVFCNDIDGPKTKKRKVDGLSNHFEEIPGTPVILLPHGISACNSKLMSITEKIKPMIRDLLDHANMVKMWIAFSIPKIEDGNNFGVSVQEDTLAEARQVENDAASYLEQVSRYFISRGKLVSKIAKYPHIADYRQSVKEIDEKEYTGLRLICCELRNHYASLHDVIIKNLEKIKKPRSTNAENLY